MDHFSLLLLPICVFTDNYFLPFSLVAREPLKKVLSSGVLDKMDKAMMFLVQKSASGVVDQSRVGAHRPNHPVSIELLDDNGERVIEDSGKSIGNEEVGGLVNRKRPREDVYHQQGPSSRRG